ncbi:hypothetical protein [Labrenzia sp. 011]|uniref:hypothetical protein n=1 Tax=Labrenzia sp. 011 TaxID=2171494 RepID=UPI000D51D899|nr:hypothetical protein [Labrenzia sp. 011]PVB60636.1 hypothetical protein DCO57_15685 [Labrenzia sp. 011]
MSIQSKTAHAGNAGGRQKSLGLAVAGMALTVSVQNATARDRTESRWGADDCVHAFLFVLGQARLKGAVQKIINPIAIR